MPNMNTDGVVTVITDEQYALFTSTDEAYYARYKRDNLIAETDVWALSDRTMTAEQTAYRQSLRDISSQDGFPENITWPVKPE